MMNRSSLSTHEVFNQSPPWGGGNAWKDDSVLRRACGGIGSETQQSLDALGAWAGSNESLELARLANLHAPNLRTHDAKGNRLDVVEYHPAYHALMRHGVAEGLHCSTWDDAEAEKGQRNLIRAARFFMTSQAETGHTCPLTMTNASSAALRLSPELEREWLPRIRSRRYDSAQKPPESKTGITLGMGMTEKQGGTDVRVNETKAEPLDDGSWSLTGHKWFLSAPMCDGFMVLARADGNGKEGHNGDGLGCFLIPRILPDGSENGFRFQRLKEKLGNRSNASSEVEFHGAIGRLIGEPGRGIPTILEMVTLTRLDCAIGSAGMMRVCIAEAVRHVRHRKVLGRLLIDQPMMRRVLEDMALDVVAATVLSLRLARSFDEAQNDPQQEAYARLMTPVVKYWVCKSAPPLIAEAMECLGGNGYVEEGNLARHYRDIPVNAIWEGSGNVMCLDALRAIHKNPETLERVVEGLRKDMNEDSSSKSLEVIRSAAGLALEDQGSGRILAEQLALTASVAELRRLGLDSLADAFASTRLAGAWRSTYGTVEGRSLPDGMLDELYPPGE